MIKLFVLISFFLNIFFLYLVNKEKLKTFLYTSRIKKIDITEVHEIFKLTKFQII